MDLISHLVRLKIIPFLRRWKLLSIILGSLDILGIVAAFQIAYLLNYYSEDAFFFFSQTNLIKLLALILPFWLVFLYMIQVTEIPRTKRYRVLFLEYLYSAALVILLLLVFYFVFKLYEISRLFLIEFTILGFLFLFFIRLLEYKIFKIYRAKGYNYINLVLIVDDSSLPFIDIILKNKEWGYKIMAIITGSSAVKEKFEKDIILLEPKYQGVVKDLMEVDLIDEIFYLKEKVVPSEVREIARFCEEVGVTFRLKHKNASENLTNAIKTTIADEKFLTFINVPHNQYALAIKKVLDIGISFLLVVLLSPFLLLIGILIKTSSPGPVIFRQKRIGLRGRHFNLYKFRTMVTDAEEILRDLNDKNEMDGPVFKIKDDPRITKIGGFLRKTGLDELPQLFNILKGEMSLIGPRPPLQSETIQYKRWQLRRLSVKPGLSCFWQIKPERNTIKFEKWMEMDLAYIDNWSLRLDFVIFLKTIRTVFQRSGL
jgi:exopolysaccharide biosynthesis polyprenyl glycosylphosphotransferase